MTQTLPDRAHSAPSTTAATTARRPYPTYRDSGVPWLGQIPAHWAVKRLKHWSTFVTSGSRGWADHYSNSGPLFIRIGDLSSDAIDISLSDVQHVTPPSNAEGRRTRIHSNDVLISITANVGAVGLAPANIPEAYVNQHVAIARPRQNCVAPRWAAYCLASDASGQQFDSLMYGGTKEGLNLDDVRALIIPIPPLDEQRAIANYLDRETTRLDALIAAKQRLITLLREKRTALISYAVTCGLDADVALKESGVPWLRQIPAHWEVKRLKFIITSIEQGWSPECESRRAEGDEWGVLKVGCVNGTTFDESEHKALPTGLQPRPELEIKPGDVLMSRANTRELLGSASVVGDVRPRLLLCDKLYRLNVKREAIDQEFLVAALGSSSSRDQFEREATGASSSMQNIAQSTVRELWLAVPPISEQRMILAQIHQHTMRIDMLASAIEQQIERLREYRSAVIAAAVTGQFEVR